MKRTLFFMFLLLGWRYVDAQVEARIKTNMGHSRSISDFATTDDGKWLFTGGKGQLILWDMMKAKEVFSLSTNPSSTDAVDISRDGTVGVSVGTSKEVIIWDLLLGRLLKTVQVPEPALKVSLHQNKDKIFVMGQRNIWLVNATDGVIIGTASTSGFFHDLILLDKKNWVVTSSTSGEVKKWSMDDLSDLGTIYESPNRIGYVLCATPDQLTIVAGDSHRYQASGMTKGNLHIINVESGIARVQPTDCNWSGDNCILSIAYAPKGNRILLSDKTGATREYMRATMKETFLFEDDKSWSSSVAYTEANNRLLGYNDRSVVMFTPNQDQAQRMMTGKGLYISDMDVFDEEALIGLGSSFAMIFDMSQMKFINQFNWHTPESKLEQGIVEPIGAIKFVPSSGMVLTASKDAYVKVGNPHSGILKDSIFMNEKRIQAIAISQDFTTIASASNDLALNFTVDPISKYAKVIKNPLTDPQESLILDGKGNWSEAVTICPTTGKIAFSTDVKTILLYSKDGSLLHTITGLQDEVWDLRFIQNGQKILAADKTTFYEIATSTGKITKTLLTEGALSMAANENTAALGLSNGAIQLINTQSFIKGKVLTGHDNPVSALVYSKDGNYLYSSSMDGSAKVWDLRNIPNHVTLIPDFKGNAFVAFTQDGYYTGSKEQVSDYAHFVTPNRKIYTFDQFDLQYNRPDIILQRLGKASSELVAAYKKAWEKRLWKMGFDPANFEAERSFNVPELALAAEVDAFKEVTTPNYQFSISAEDKLFNLDRLFVNVNGVPLYGIKGKSLLSAQAKTTEQNITIPLSSGKNIIKVSVMNEKGVESLAEQFEVTYKPASPILPDLHVIAIGVSKFVQSDYNLTYADKDANDLAALLKDAQGYGQIYIHSFTNEQATPANILAVRSELEQTKPDDEVVVFVASHGLLDDELDYYIAMHGTQFENPKVGGLRYDQLENLLDGIPARNKLMLLDACHSGEVDKEESVLVAANTVSENGVKSRGFKAVKTESAGIGLQSSFELMKELFADLRRNNGAIVISSASGQEFAFESSEWHNGVFTYSVLEGIKSGNADANKDKTINVSELRDYVSKRVVELTNGKQNPTSRTENLENDFLVWLN